MDKGISRNLDTAHIPVSKLASLMESFTMKNSARQLADILGRAENNSLSYHEFLLDLLETEVKCRNDRRRKRNYAGAHFPPNVRPIDEFDPAELEEGITSSQIRQLKELNWLDAYGNIILAEPPGLGKTMIATGLGLEAINSGYTVCFERMSNFVKILDRSETERSAGFRLKNIQKAQLVIIDEIGYTPISR